MQKSGHRGAKQEEIWGTQVTDLRYPKVTPVASHSPLLPRAAVTDQARASFLAGAFMSFSA